MGSCLETMKIPACLSEPHLIFGITKLPVEIPCFLLSLKIYQCALILVFATKQFCNFSSNKFLFSSVSVKCISFLLIQSFASSLTIFCNDQDMIPGHDDNFLWLNRLDSLLSPPSQNLEHPWELISPRTRNKTHL